MTTTSRATGHATATRVSLAVAVVGGLGFVVVAWLLVPWQPVPGGMPPAADPRDWFSAEEIARAEDYARQARILGWSSLAVSLLVSSLLGFTARGRALMGRLPGPWWGSVLLGTGLVLLAGRLATLPFVLASRDLRLEVGLTRQSLPSYLRDLAVSFGVSWAVTGLALVVLVGCVRRWSRWWPAIVGGLLAAFVLLGSFVYPVLIEPLFNSFEPLADGPLRTRIMEVADAEGVAVDDVLVADASRRTTTLNAYVSGFGDTRRVVVYDNLVEDLPEDQALSVVAHELAHAKYDDVLVGSVLGALGAFTAVGLLGLVTARSPAVLRTSAAVPLVLALSAWGSLLVAPVENGISRRVETRADVVALETSHDPDAFVAMQRQLALRSLSDPTPPAWSQWWFGSHPTTLERIAVAEQSG